MRKIDREKLVAFRKQYNDLIGRAIVEGLLNPSQVPDFPPIGIHAQDGNYIQDGGDYEQSTGGTHEQSGGGGYKQSPATVTDE